MNVRTYHKLCMSGVVGFVFVGLGIFGGENAFFAVVSVLGLFWVIGLGVMGAVTAIMMMRGKLKMGCPKCERMSRVDQSGRAEMTIECKKCGPLIWEIAFSRLIVMTPEQLKERSQRRAKLRRKKKVRTGSPLKAPLWYPKSFAVIFAPVLVSVVAASWIHQFSFFYIIIPGFWCYGVGSFSLHSLMSGEVSMNGRDIMRSESPIAFWLSMIPWIPFYAFALVFPVGFALQESGKSLDDLFSKPIERYEEVPEFDVR